MKNANSMHQSRGGRRFVDARRHVVLMCFLPLAALAWSGAAAATTQADKPACKPASVTTVDGLAGDAAEIVAFDLSGSTHSTAVRDAYKQLGTNVMTRARDERAVFAILTFTSSSSSARLAYAGSFKPSTGDEVFDLGQKNRVTCEGGVVIDRLFAPARGRARTTAPTPPVRPPPLSASPGRS